MVDRMNKHKKMKTVYKLIMFVAYHTLIFSTVWIISDKFLSPFFEQEWVNGTNWIRHTSVVLGKTTFMTTLLWSILSCFTSKKLTKTQIGQWSLSDWMPEWGKNEKNSWYGIFTGLPMWFINIQAVDSVSKTEEDIKQIQIEKHNNEVDRFAVEFEFNFKWMIVDTYTFIKNPNTVEDLKNFITTTLTEYFNDPSHNYQDTLELKKDIQNIQNWILESARDLVEMYGVEINTFKLINIELPNAQVKQQIDDAKAKQAQEAQAERKMLKTKAFIDQVKQLLNDTKDADGNQTMSWFEAAEVVMKIRGIVKVSEIKGAENVFMIN